ncbi:RNA polymerase sigma factor [Paremcibacter congregatus]|uniref:RNA polymerase subunit sigma-70 n=1 Tax=Paremcibacter congregatus TaxID=2043170 RepID=A0A2G4YSA6_9PROT|nr:RNA polymerase sigma factor [Paremcibacter congregatus]PHZ85208.1 hypothetical protein CRD36_07305 [Paremcibacter congregatus]QDE27858.1 RNA polymerase sigma factor [Paremcibacter congregatus]
MRSDATPVIKQEKSLVRKQNAGRGAFMSRVVEEYQKGLHRFIYAKVKCQDVAAEITQETFLRIMRLDRPEELEYPQAYLYRVAHNLVIDKQRRDNLKVIDGSVDLDVEACEGTEASPEECLDYKQTHEDFLRAFEELPLRPRQVFYLRRYENLKVSQIAEKLGISTRMVHKHMTNSLAHLELKLKPKDQMRGDGK